MDDLISEFIEETSESLSALDNEVVRLESNPDDMELIGSIFRLLHTVKGTCGFLGLPRLASVAHSGENVLGKIRDRELAVTPEAISLVLASLDRIKQLMDHLASEGAEPAGDDSELINRLDSFAAGGAPAARPEPVLTTIVSASSEMDELERLFNETPVDENFFDNNDIEAMANKLRQEAKEEANTDKEENLEVKVPTPPAPAAKAADVKARAVEEGLKTNITEHGEHKAGAAGGQSIRVNLELLEKLMDTVSELVLTRNQLLQISRSRDDSDFTSPIQRLARITSDLQEGVMKTRMQPISNAWSKFPRLVRDLSMDLNKKINLHMVGEETELDRQLLEMIKDPLTHMVRNSIDHGLEGPADRMAAGKSEAGNVYLRAFHEGGNIVVEIEDDGRGLNLKRIKEKAVVNGIASEAELAEMSDQRIMQFIFHPGFSTAEKVTSVSGRGVGMDVVRSNIEKIGGSVDLSSKEGKGSLFRIKIPLTLAIVSVLLLEAGKQKFAIPQTNVNELVYAHPSAEYRIEMVNDSPVLRLRDKLLSLVDLSGTLGMGSTYKNDCLGGVYVVVCNAGGCDFGVIVDRVFDTEEIVVKPLAPLLQTISMYSGCTILGDGSVIVILDPNTLARTAGQASSGQVVQQKESKHIAFANRQIKFLVFRAGDETPKAVPLDLVSRLEEIELSRIEKSAGMSVVQYLGGLMLLSSLGGSDIGEPREGDLYPVIVFQYDNKTIGLVIDEILDVVEAHLDIKMASRDDIFIGGMVIDGKATDVVDVGSMVTKVIGDFASTGKTGENAEKKVVLVVDDSKFFRNVSAPYLSAQGFEVLTAESPIEAFDIMRERGKVDLIISDIEMPEMTGIDFARKCKSMPEYKEVPMIAFTSKMTSESIREGIDAGFKVYLSKTDRDGLIREVGTLLG